MVLFSRPRTALMAAGREAAVSQARRRIRLTAGGSSESGRFGNTCIETKGHELSSFQQCSAIC